MKLVLALAALLQAAPADTSDAPFTAILSPGTLYDAAIPTLKRVVGHDFNQEITAPEDILRYMEALAAAAPDRTHLFPYATSWEGRPLVMMVIGSRERMARLDEIRADLATLADPRGLSEADGEALLARLPVVTALMHGVHGNEITSSGAAMAEAYHLLAARNDTTVDRIRSESLVIVDPVENPDGRARFVLHQLMDRSRWPDPLSWSAEHDEPWPGGRVNHYLFDMNRDLFIQSQPETRGKTAAFLEWRPQIVADLHEMGGNSTYFFPPTAPPENPWFTDAQIGLMDVFGRDIAGAFDERGFAYFNRDTYDLFYPGYVDMWPMSHGALGMTFEQASPRALVFLRGDGGLLTYGQGIHHHWTAAIQTAATAARNRERILRDYLDFRRNGVELGTEGPAEYVLHSAHDPGMAERLARLLVRNGIEVHEASGPVRIADRTLPARGTYVVPMAQPAHRLARILLDDHVPMDSAFIQRQIERRARRESDEIYDVTAWSQPLLWDVERLASARATGARGEPLTAERMPGAGVALPEARVGYLIPWGTEAAAAVAEALRVGIRVRAAGEAFTLGGRRYGVGTAIVRGADNGPDLRGRLGDIAAGHGVEVIPVDDSYVERGASLGSNSVRALREPRVLLAWDEPASANSAGWARYVLERRYGQRVGVVRGGSLGRARLDDYDVVILPSGSYSGVLAGGTLERLRTWIREGGTLVTLGSATSWAAREGVGLLDATPERRGGRPEGSDPPREETPEQPVDYLEAITPADEGPEAVPGAILRMVLDTNHWLSAGTDGEVGAFVQSSRIFSPLTLDQGANVGRYGELEDLVMSGIVWEESRAQLANKPYLMHQSMGQGQVVAFVEDPNYRAYTEATMLLFVNAVLLGPGR
jgi:hypothetical protein